MLSQNFIWLALAVNVSGDLFYVRDTLKGETQPNRVTFLLWTLAPLVGYFAQLNGHAGKQLLYTLSLSAITFLILLASFVDKKAYWKITTFDVFCGLLSVIALILLIITRNSVLTLALSIIADIFAGLPTLIKSYKHPESETAIAYAFGVISSFIAILTIHKWIFINYGFAVYVFLSALAFSFILTFRQRSLKTS